MLLYKAVMALTRTRHRSTNCSFPPLIGYNSLTALCGGLRDEVAMSEFDYKLRTGLLVWHFRVIYIFIYRWKIDVFGSFLRLRRKNTWRCIRMFSLKVEKW